jgi:hypothetical protein
VVRLLLLPLSHNRGTMVPVMMDAFDTNRRRPGALIQTWAIAAAAIGQESIVDGLLDVDGDLPWLAE